MKAFSDSLSIAFDMKIYSDGMTGYVIHLRTDDDKDAPIIDFFYDGSYSSHDFGIIWEGNSYIIHKHVPKKEIDAKWIGISLTLYPKTDSVVLRVGEEYAFGGTMDLPEKLRPSICFGKSGYLIDVPSFAIRNLFLSGDSYKVSFKLDEDSGNLAKSSSKKLVGHVVNPIWLMNDSYHWKQEWRYRSNSFMSVGYDNSKNEIYSFNRDSIFFLNIDDKSIQELSFKERCPVKISLGTNFIDPRTGDIYCYEVYYPLPKDEGTATMARLDRDELTWTPLTYEHLDMQMHHHDEFMDTLSGKFIIFGGFGNRRYNGDFHAFDLDSLKWYRMPPAKGDVIWPRYFSAMGHDSESDKLYVFGGMGNESGDQVVGRQYFYDLYEFSRPTNQCRKLWSIPWEGQNCVAVRNMIVPSGQDCFYVACYPEFVTESQLQIYRFSIKDGSFEKLADPVPIFSDKITTNANLYYDESLEKLILTVEESPDDITSTVTVFSIDFPPKTAGVLTVVRERNRKIVEFSLLGIGLLFVIWFLAKRIIRRNRLKAKIPEYVSIAEPKDNAILLFGQFTVKDRFGNDITSQFTSKLMQLLCLVLRYHEGLTSKRISSILWPDKEENEAKNVRGVTISNFRKVLSQIEGVSLVFNDNKFSLQTNDSFYCDYLAAEEISKSEKPDMDRLINIFHRGGFLKSEFDPMYDKFKENVEGREMSIMQVEIARRFNLKQYHACVVCAEIIFNVDPYNEEALSYAVRSYKNMKRGTEAAELYNSFVTRYRSDYGENYPKSFEDIR